MNVVFNHLLAMTLTAFCPNAAPPLSTAQEDEKPIVIRIGFDEQEEEEENKTKLEQKKKQKEQRKQKLQQKQRQGNNAEEEIEFSGTIIVNGQAMRIDNANLEALLENNFEDLGAWAETHSADWEKWAETFESRMERWAEKTEKQWEGWAEKYSSNWESWAEQLASGEIEASELSALLERNLEMLNDMPLAELIDGALKNSLGELENAPLESLGELNELVGGALEKSLRAIELEVQGVAQGTRDREDQQYKAVLVEGGKATAKLNKAMSKLHESIARKDDQLDAGAQKKLAALEDLLLQEKELDEKSRDMILEALKKTLAKNSAEEQQAVLRRQEQERTSKAELATAARQKTATGEQRAANQRAADALRQAIDARRNLDTRREIANARNAELNAARAAKLKAQQAMDIRAVYEQLKLQQEKLADKESELEAMRREISELRDAVRKIKEAKK